MTHDTAPQELPSSDGGALVVARGWTWRRVGEVRHGAVRRVRLLVGRARRARPGHADRAIRPNPRAWLAAPRAQGVQGVSAGLGRRVAVDGLAGAESGGSSGSRDRAAASPAVAGAGRGSRRDHPAAAGRCRRPGQDDRSRPDPPRAGRARSGRSRSCPHAAHRARSVARGTWLALSSRGRRDRPRRAARARSERAIRPRPVPGAGHRPAFDRSRQATGCPRTAGLASAGTCWSSTKRTG